MRLTRKKDKIQEKETENVEYILAKKDKKDIQTGAKLIKND